MAGYTRQADALIQADEDVNAEPLASEFNAIASAFSGTTGHGHTGGTGDGPKIVLTAAAGVSGLLPIANGGTGAATAANARTALGLGTAAVEAATAFATAAQGLLADSSVQPGDIGAVATSNAYADLDGKPTLGTAAATAATDYATAAQGALADTSIQENSLYIWRKYGSFGSANFVDNGSDDDLALSSASPFLLASCEEWKIAGLIQTTSGTTAVEFRVNDGGTLVVSAATGEGNFRFVWEMTEMGSSTFLHRITVTNAAGTAAIIHSTTNTSTAPRLRVKGGDASSDTAIIVLGSLVDAGQ